MYIKRFFEHKFCKIMDQMGLFIIISIYKSAHISPQTFDILSITPTSRSIKCCEWFTVLCDSLIHWVDLAVYFPIIGVNYRSRSDVQVWNADLRKQMAHHCSVSYKDLTVMPFWSAINKCQTRTSDKLKKCLHSVVLLFRYVEIYHLIKFDPDWSI